LDKLQWKTIIPHAVEKEPSSSCVSACIITCRGYIKTVL
jgi:hypothetical protein